MKPKKLKVKAWAVMDSENSLITVGSKKDLESWYELELENLGYKLIPVLIKEIKK